VEPILAAKSYYLEPEQTGTRAYVLFRDALEESGKVAVAKVALRQREALAALRVRDGVITLETLLWPDEIRKPDFAFLDEDIEVRSQELKMASSLIETMTEDFEPDQYHDTYRQALEAVVQAKVEGNDVVRPAGFEAPEPKSPPADLTEILRASVAALKTDRAPAKPTAKPAPSAKTAAKPAVKAAARTRAKAAPATDEDSEAQPKTTAKTTPRRKASA
jgi:DNA end-binding protein Ku